MKLTNETKLYLQLRSAKKRNKTQLETMRNMMSLIGMVSPAKVYHVDELAENHQPTLSTFAKEHGYNISTFLRKLRKEKVLVRIGSTWLLTPEYKRAGLVFYTIGRTDRYSCLDMYLTPDGVLFMEAFIAAHPTRPMTKRKE